MILLDAFGSMALVRLAASLEEKLRKPSSLTVNARATLLEILNALRSSFDFVQRFHRACFYWGGGFYHVSKRITGIEYVSITVNPLALYNINSKRGLTFSNFFFINFFLFSGVGATVA